MKLAGVVRDANHKAAFNDFLKEMAALDQNFSWETFKGLGIHRYGFIEILEVFGKPVIGD